VSVPDHERREAWESVAEGWERQNERVAQFAAPVTRRMVELLDPRRGETILEVAAGVGDTGFAAAERIRPGGRLISSDFAEPMVEAARRRAADVGAGDVEFLVADAQELPLPDASVDGVLCRWAYMLMPDPVRALREARRVLRPAAGRLAFAVWSGVERNPWATSVGRTLVRLGHVEPPDPAAPGMFALGDPERLEALLREAGFASVELEEVELSGEDRNFDEYWASVLDMSMSARSTMARLGDEQAAEVRVAVEAEVEPYRVDGGYRFPGLCLVGLARGGA
jgi:ubiquinone/menaquinone biosynthesis C-methylase UbiE